MKRGVTFILTFFTAGVLIAQDTMKPENLWQVEEVSYSGLTEDHQYFFYTVKSPNLDENKFDSAIYKMPVKGGDPRNITTEELEKEKKNKNLSPDGRYLLFHKKVQVEEVKAKDKYTDLPKSEGYIFKGLDYRHWDHYNDGGYNHVFYKDKETAEEVDIMPDEPYYTPQAPFGGDEDYVWGPQGKSIYYVSKKELGTAYALSTDTDIYKYDLATQKTANLTPDNKGYDTNPQFSQQGAMGYLQMKAPGYEADKNDIVVLENGVKQNLTGDWDGTVNSFLWDDQGKTIFFTAPVDGTIQLFRVNYPGRTRMATVVEQLSEGQFDVTGLHAQVENRLLVSLSDMNATAEIYSFDLENRGFTKLTQVNDAFYAQFDLPEVKKRYVKTKDGSKMLVWVILPPNFDASKKYPTLLYAQGGPQSALSQFYSRRWNFQLMASQGYIVIAPNRRGMPGHGVKWNEIISGDWGGGAMQDYLDAIDALAKESYVDSDRLGAVGASFGGYSMFWLAGHHQGRFKTFIAHDGVFDTRAMYGTTEELFFVNHDFGGPYWDQDPQVQKSYQEFNPINYVQKWDTPMLIIQGGKDYRVPIEQGLGAFQAAQLRGIKSKLLYFPSENHWVLQPQNALVWQREFFSWLKETL